MDDVFVEDECELPEDLDRRWYLVAVAGTSLSFISLFSNLLIARALLTRRRSHFFFLGLLAVSDSFLSFCYGPVIAMDIIKNRVQAIWLNRLWWSYIGPLLALCHVSMTFSCFLIILATIERYLITRKSKYLQKFRTSRGALATFMFTLALVVRGTAVFEIEVKRNANCTGLTEYEPMLTPLVSTWLYGTVFRFYLRNILTVFIPFALLAYLNVRIVATLRAQRRKAAMFKFACSEHKVKRNANCTGLTEYEPMLTPLVSTWLYGTVFRFYLRNILTVFIPFALLAYLNVRIVATLRAQRRKAAMFKFACSEHKMKIRSATRLTVFIVCSYLMANVLNVLITAWEYVDFESAMTADNFWIYELCTDVISVLYVFTCATRLLVYMLCNKEIRIAIIETICCYMKDNAKYCAVDERPATKRNENARIGTEFDDLAIRIARRMMMPGMTNRPPDTGKSEQPLDGSTKYHDES
ncbi:hypothetical protein Tcan_10153 [Toxocara canis]|uniref:G-protein coupled receptors family 1 profile domain-containing protein n=1 Tax=Toxocara canis TaxID=6265 RepID=A0A0B2VBB3_TOXCA|nr:hypothetical protein Tcan_10153 [Toxocara canis]